MFKTLSRAIAVATLALAGVATTASASDGSSLTFKQLTTYMKANKVCTGSSKLLTGKSLTAGEVKAHIVGALACEPRSTATLVLLDYFDTNASLKKVTGVKNFITAKGCKTHSYDCAVTMSGKWLFVGLVNSNLPKDRKTGEATMKVDQQLMTPSVIAAKA
jgi:hypothetical protein